MKVKCLESCKAKLSNQLVKSYEAGEVYEFSEKESNIFCGSGKFEHVVEALKVEAKIINPVEEVKAVKVEKPKPVKKTVKKAKK